MKKHIKKINKKRKRFSKKVKEHFREVLEIKTSTHSIALGFAIGTFISMLPTPGFNILLGFLIILIFKRINKFSLFGSLVLWNPLTLFPFYFLMYKLGNLMFSSAPVIRFNIVIIDQIYNFSRRFLIANIIIAIIMSIISYFVVRMVAEKYKKRKY